METISVSRLLKVLAMPVADQPVEPVRVAYKGTVIGIWVPARWERVSAVESAVEGRVWGYPEGGSGGVTPRMPVYADGTGLGRGSGGPIVIPKTTDDARRITRERQKAADDILSRVNKSKG